MIEPRALCRCGGFGAAIFLAVCLTQQFAVPEPVSAREGCAESAAAGAEEAAGAGADLIGFEPWGQAFFNDVFFVVSRRSENRLASNDSLAIIDV